MAKNRPRTLRVILAKDEDNPNNARILAHVAKYKIRWGKTSWKDAHDLKAQGARLGKLRRENRQEWDDVQVAAIRFGAVIDLLVNPSNREIDELVERTKNKEPRKASWKPWP